MAGTWDVLYPIVRWAPYEHADAAPAVGRGVVLGSLGGLVSGYAAVAGLLGLVALGQSNWLVSIGFMMIYGPIGAVVGLIAGALSGLAGGVAAAALAAFGHRRRFVQRIVVGLAAMGPLLMLGHWLGVEGIGLTAVVAGILAFLLAPRVVSGPALGRFLR